MALLRIRLLAVGSSLAFLAACSSPPGPPAADHTVTVPKSAGVYKIGNPYQIDNVWYYPREQPDYDETGIASWYGPTFYGKRTANGEIYDGNKLTAAHRTLPMPVNVRVTNLENGKSLVVRVNDRGPYARGRIIDLSRRAAELLDVIKTGTARVRVTYLGRAPLEGSSPVDETPPEIAKALPAAPSGKVDMSVLESVPGIPVESSPLPSVKPNPVPIPDQMFVDDNEPDGKVTKMPIPATTRLYVQVGAFSNLQNARMLLGRLGNNLHISTIQRDGRTLYRVRTGPLASVAEADTALAQLTGAGANDAQIVVDQ